MTFTADGVEHSAIAISPGELHFTTPKELMLGMKPDDINAGIKQVTGRAMKVRVTPTTAAVSAGAPMKKAPAASEAEDEVSKRALDNEEVRRFRELFGGQVRQVRNLKE